jgi:spore coat polysaccharide biosynthesis protein SpsF (cytidylyltransferase family)
MLTVIQARIESSRFPGKMLEKLGSRTLLDHVIDFAHDMGIPVVATQDNKTNNVIASRALKSDCGVIRAMDPIDRYIMAAQRGENYIMRICGDNPFLSRKFGMELIRAVEKNPGADYYAHYIGYDPAIMTSYGLFAEVFRADALIEGVRKTKMEKHYREHVTNLFYQNEDKFNIVKLPVPEEITNIKFSLTVDTPDDLKRLNKLANELPENCDWPEIVEAVSESRKFRTKSVEKEYEWYVHNR